MKSRRPRLRATAVLASAALNLAARIAIPVIVLNGVSGVASAQTWNGPGADWNTATNWIPATIPGANGIAIFGGALPTSISMAGGVRLAREHIDWFIWAQGHTF